MMKSLLLLVLLLCAACSCCGCRVAESHEFELGYHRGCDGC